MGLRDLKIPRMDFKHFKIKMDDAEEELSRIDYEKLEKKPIKKRNKPYEDRTNYKTVKEFFYRSVEKFSNEPCIKEKPSHKEPYKTVTYKEFYDDICAFGTSLLNLLNLKDKRVIIIGETQYGWYLSYMALLCGGIIAVPTDRELPYHELENIVRRSKASAIIYSQKKADEITKIKENVTEVELFIEINEKKPHNDKN